MKQKVPLSRFLHPVCRGLAFAMLAGTTHAGTNIFNFNSDPSGILSVTRGGDNAELTALAGFWSPNGGSTLETGVVNQSTNGYFAITQTTPSLATHGMRSVIVFDDFDNGLVVAGFSFSCDVRIGGGSATPADGFSLNFARDTDPVLFGGNFGSGPNNNPANTPEEGTTTGLVISFDAFANSGSDPIGITIKVDNNVLTNITMPTLNGACGDLNSLQTGPNTAGTTNLCWQPLNVILQTNGLLSVSYKSTTFLTNFQTTFTPGPGRLVFAGRTGGSYQEQDVDNIRIVTIAPSSPVVGPSIGNANGFRFNISDSGFTTPDTNTISLTLDGVSVPVISIIQTGNVGGGNGVTTVGYRNPNLLLAPGSTHTNTVQFSGSTFAGTVSVTNIFVVPAYTILTTAQQAPGVVDTNLSGFTGRIHQLPIPRYPISSDLIGIERQMADAYIDPNTSQPYVSTTSVTNFNNEMINWNQDQIFGGMAGLFSPLNPPPADTPDDPIPGIDFSSISGDYIAAEILTILDLPVGAYQLGVYHDDGFKLSVGSEPRDLFKSVVLSSSTGSGDTSPINIVVTNAGKYPFRLLWGEDTGGAQVEFYLFDLTTGQRILINNRLNPVQIVSYSDTAALTQPYVRWVSPAPGETGVSPSQPVIAKLQDGAAGSIIPGSVSLKLNGNGTATVAKSGTETTATLLNAFPSSGTVVTATLVYSTTAGGPFTNTWTFTQSYYGQVLFNLPLNEGTNNLIADTAQGLTGSFLTSPLWTNNTPAGTNGDYALFFDGARRASFNDPNRLITLGPVTTGTNGDYTAECWVKLPLGFEPTARMILFQYEGTHAFAFSINTGRTLHTTTFGLNDVNSTAVVPNDNQWHHVAAVHENGVRMLFYIDGALVSGVPYTRGVGTRTTFAVTVGAASGGANGFTGSLDRIRFSKGALKPNQFDIPIVPAPDTTPGDISSALAVHLKLDEMTGLTAADSSGNSHDMSLLNFPGDDSQWVASRFGGGINMGGSVTTQRGSVNDPGNTLNFSAIPAFSVAAWIKAPVAGQSNGGGVIAKGSGGGGEQFTMDIQNGGILRFFVRNASGTVFTVASLGNSTNTINGNWIHAVAVCDMANPTNGLKFYFNGLPAIQANAPTTLLNSSHEVSIGARESSAVSGYDLFSMGVLDDIRIYKRALTARDVRTLYQEADALRLTLTRNGNTGTFAWPAWLGNHFLQGANTLSTTPAWSDVGGTPVLNGYYFNQSVTLQPGSKFYRLRP